MPLTTKTLWNALIDYIAYIAFCLLISTGIIMKYILLSGSERTLNDPSAIWGWGRHDWGGVHFWGSIVFIIMIVLHVILHWSWLVGVLRRLSGSPSRKIIALTLIVPIILTAIPLLGTRGQEEGEEHGKPSIAAEHKGKGNAHSPGALGFFVRGRTTLQEIEDGTGIKVEILLSELGLPNDVPKNEHLMIILRSFPDLNLEINAVRKVVDQLAEQK